MVQRDELFEFDAPKYADIAEEMANGPPDDHDDPWFHEVCAFFLSPPASSSMRAPPSNDAPRRKQVHELHEDPDGKNNADGKPLVDLDASHDEVQNATSSPLSPSSLIPIQHKSGHFTSWPRQKARVGANGPSFAKRARRVWAFNHEQPQKQHTGAEHFTLCGPFLDSHRNFHREIESGLGRVPHHGPSIFIRPGHSRAMVGAGRDRDVPSMWSSAE